MLAATATVAADGQGAPYAGRQVVAVLEDFRDAGYPFVYSTYLVSEDLLVVDEPDAGSPAEMVRQILEPYGLTLRQESGVYVVVRAEPAVARPAATPAPEPPPPDIETVVVAASRYAISRDPSASMYSLDQRTIQNMPDVGEDPIRVTQRLPGTAASGASALAHFRGGEENEIGIMLNGQWLFDPFHVRDYQNIFSTIDARAIDGVEVYVGGFPVRYGDRLSGMVLMDSLDLEESRHTEIGVSVFNTSLLLAGAEATRNWVFSARRGNLDLVIDPQYGQPSYFDVFGEYTFDITPNTSLSLNGLYADDQVLLVLETDPAEREQAVSDTQNTQLWLRLDSEWSSGLSSSTVLSYVDFSNRREGDLGDPEKMIARVRDDRDVEQVGFRQDWAFSAAERHLTQWGVQALFSKADYAYHGEAEYFGLQAIYIDQPPYLVRELTANPEGGSYALYVSDRWQLAENALVEWGLRWDDQTYTELDSDSQLSPRLNVLLQTGAKTELRLSAGRYYQSQPIQRLQIEDGLTNFWPAQRGDNVVAGVQHLFSENTSARLEVFQKTLSTVRPRFENLYDPLGLMPELQADRVRLDPTSATARGIEVSAEWTSGDWDVWAAYTWSEVTDRINGRDERRSWDQRHTLLSGVDWHTEKWSFSAAASIHSGWPTTDLFLLEDGVDEDGEAAYVAVPGRRNVLNFPTYASVDFRLSRRFDVPRGSLLVFFEVSNAFNHDNICCIDYDEEEDSAGNPILEYSYDYWLPMLPAIGILWEF